jgi:S-formylglutathione hydrolase
MKLLKKHKTFGGETQFFEHESKTTDTKMKFSCFVPGGAPVDSALIWLSGLTCNEENFITKAGAQKWLKNTKTMIICPDTSPRGTDLPGEHETYDFGSGAGFYLNATTQGYKDHYNMYDYIVKDIVAILKKEFDVDKISIFGHSMGGHGALVLGLREPDLFKSISAFSPIVNPVAVEWGRKAFKGYLGKEMKGAEKYDATELMNHGAKSKNTILIDQGTNDEFLDKHLKPENFVKACKKAGQKLELRMQEGYDHSYYFISSFLEDHIKFHLKALK